REVGGSNPLAPTKNLSKNKEEGRMSSGLFFVCAVFCAKRLLVDHFGASCLRFQECGLKYSGSGVKRLATYVRVMLDHVMRDMADLGHDGLIRQPCFCHDRNRCVSQVVKANG